MESMGQKLREARERFNVSLEQVARDTHISKQYLEALEAESFAVIPGETYIVGFLRNYAEYLALNPEELVSLYKGLKIQEQPLPMTELLDRGRPGLPGRALLIALALLVVLGGAGYLLYRLGVAGRERVPAAEAPARGVEGPGAEYRIQEEAITRWFDQGDVLLVSVEGGSFAIGLTDISDRLSARVPGGTVELSIGEERQLDLNTDGRNDVRLRLNDLDATATARRANISLYAIKQDTVAQALPTQPADTGVPAQAPAPPTAQPQAAAPQPQAAAPTTPTQVPAPEARQQGEPAVQAAAPAAARAAGTGAATVLTASGPSPFRLSMSFRGYCLLRYNVDNEMRDERFFHRGESFALDARNEAMLWISNVGAVRLSVNGRDVELGRPGSVATRLIRWNRDEASGQYALQVLDRE